MEVNFYENLSLVPEFLPPTQAEPSQHNPESSSQSSTQEDPQQGSAPEDTSPSSPEHTPTQSQQASSSLENPLVVRVREEEDRLVGSGSDLSDAPSDVDEVPTTKENARVMLRDMALERYHQSQDDPDYEPVGSKDRKGPMKLYKLNWAVARNAAVLALLDDPSATLDGHIQLNLDPWTENYALARFDLGIILDSVTTHAAAIAGFWMKDTERRLKLAEASTVGLGEEAIDELDADNDTPRGKSKGKEKVPTAGKEMKDYVAEEVVATGSKRAAPGTPNPPQTPSKRQKHAQHQDDAGTGGSKKRGARDLEAQRAVKEYYRGVSALTGHGNSQAAHLWPISVRSHAMVDLFWSLLDRVWSAAKVKEWREALESDLGTWTNILPMESTAHDMFDRFEFALKPIQCPSGSDRRILFEIDTRLALHVSRRTRRDGTTSTTIGRKEDNRRQRHQYLTNYRKPITGDNGQTGFRELVHGNVIEIITTTPTTMRLPSYTIANATYHLTMFVAALKAAGLLEQVFRGPPPDVDPVSASTRRLGEFEEMMLFIAVWTGFMTLKEQGRWRAAALMEQREKQSPAVLMAREKSWWD